MKIKIALLENILFVLLLVSGVFAAFFNTVLSMALVLISLIISVTSTITFIGIVKDKGSYRGLNIAIFICQILFWISLIVPAQDTTEERGLLVQFVKIIVIYVGLIGLLILSAIELRKMQKVGSYNANVSNNRTYISTINANHKTLVKITSAPFKYENTQKSEPCLNDGEYIKIDNACEKSDSQATLQEIQEFSYERFVDAGLFIKKWLHENSKEDNLAIFVITVNNREEKPELVYSGWTKSVFKKLFCIFSGKKKNRVSAAMAEGKTVAFHLYVTSIKTVNKDLEKVTAVNDAINIQYSSI
jgi:hypothetical protein